MFVITEQALRTWPGSGECMPGQLSFLLEVADLDEAIAWAAQNPGAWRGKIELRPIAPVHA